MTKNEKQEELWKDVKDWSNYEVSNLGNVRNKKTKRILKPVKQQEHDYLTVNLSDGKRRETKLIHRLVAEAFCPNPDNLQQVNHIDENTHNNVASNMHWCTQTYNINYSANRNAVIEQYTKNGEFVKDYPSLHEVWLQNNPNWNKANVCMCLKGMTKSAYGYVWKYRKDD